MIEQRDDSLWRWPRETALRLPDRCPLAAR
jgi:hypothetical protein